MIAWETARHRWRTLLGSFLALTLGIGLLAMTTIVVASATPQPDPRFADADVLVAPPAVGQDPGGADLRAAWTDEEADSLVDSLGQVEGVRFAAADRGFRVEVAVGGRQITDAHEDEKLGRGWSAAVLGGTRLVEGSPPSGPQDVVVPADLGIETGTRVELLRPVGSVDAVVTGSSTGPWVHVADEQAADWSSGVGALGLVLEEGADEESVVASTRSVVDERDDVLAGEDRAALESGIDRSQRSIGAQLLWAMAVLSVFVSVFVVATTFAFTVAQRRREVGLLRAIGATPVQIRRMLLGEALIIGVAASAVGAVLGLLAAPALGAWMVEAGMQARGWEPDVRGIPVVGSVVVGTLVALAGVWAASRRAARTPPLVALQESAVEHRAMTRSRWVVGGLAIAAGLAMAVGTPLAESGATAGLAVGVVAALVTGLAVLAPVHVPVLVRVFLRDRSRSGEIVRAESRVGVRRIASLVAPVLVTVAFTITLTSMVKTMDVAFTGEERADIPTSHVVVPADLTLGVPDAAISRLRDAGVDPEAQLTTGMTLDGSWMDVTGSDDPPADSMSVLPRTATERQWVHGDDVEVRWPDGTVDELRVEVVDELTAPVEVSRQAVRKHDPNASAAVAWADVADVQGGARLDAALAGSGAEVVPTGSYESAGNEHEKGLIQMFLVALLGLAMGFTALSIANTMLMATGERRPDFSVLQLAGATRRQIGAFVAVETFVVVSIGSLLGLLVSWPAMYGVAAGLGDDLGRSVSVHIDWSATAAVMLLCAGIALAASVVPALRAVRHPVP